MNALKPMNKPAIETPDEAIDAIANRLQPVTVETIAESLAGRVLAVPILADRDSPAADVSAMDGYATFPGQIDASCQDVIAECAAGSPPPVLEVAKASQEGVIRIFTGAVIPKGCDRVIQREHTIERPIEDGLGAIAWTPKAIASTAGLNIRRQGENLRAGEVAVPANLLIRSPQAAAITTFGAKDVSVFRKVRVAIVTTGDELTSSKSDDGGLPPWQIRNSNAEALASIIERCSYAERPELYHGPDQPDKLRTVVDEAVTHHDIVLMTGGVSMGDHDYVPSVLASIGAETLFHRLPLRPGKPILGAVNGIGDKAKAIIGLPGNPVSATMGTVRFALPLIAKLAGITAWQRHRPVVTLTEVGTKTLPLHWMRAVRIVQPGLAELVIGKGSGDLVSLAQSDGFIEMPPHANHAGPWPFFDWE